VGLLLDLPKGAASDPAARERLWAAARRASVRGVPVVLAGSLAAADVPAAVARVAPAMLDVCRDTERSPGLKDPDRVRRFLAAAGTVEVNRAQ
jgi:phosphoribosylanthranilate isomerase